MFVETSFTVTFFDHHTAQFKREQTVTQAELKELIENSTAKHKDLLPMLKLAHFGELRTKKGNSLRNNANVQWINGCEGDYDGEQISVDQAKDITKNAGVGAFIYTSPSHLPNKPRWRIGCPFSERRQPDRHEQMVARLNGLFHGALGAESFTLSQSYYYGHVVDDSGNPVAYKKNGAGVEEAFPTEYRVELIAGRPLDLCDELDSGAIGKSGRAKSDGGNGGDYTGEYTGEYTKLGELLRRAFSGESVHPSLTSIIGKMVHDGASRKLVTDFCEAIWKEAKAHNPRLEDREFEEVLDIIDWCFNKEESKQPHLDAVNIGHLYAYRPEHNYIYAPTGARWPAASVNSAFGKIDGLKAAVWLDVNRAVKQMTWAPGEAQIIKDKLIADGGFIDMPDTAVFNLYRPPNVQLGHPRGAQRWIEHVHRIYPEDAEQLIRWFAHRRQHPEVKVNHCLFLGGGSGIGKDTLLQPVRVAVGHWNCQTVSPTVLLGRFNGFLKSVMLVISEARDLGEINRPQFYEHLKGITAAPPSVLLIDEKNTHPYNVPNLVGVVLTSNHKVGGIYLPPDDRRTYVAWSCLTLDDFEPNYWNSIWNYYETGGYEAVAAYLQEYDLSDFDPAAPPPKTRAFWEIVAASSAGEQGDISDIAEQLGNPHALTINDLQRHASDADFVTWIKDRRNRRIVASLLEKCGYVPVRNSEAKDGLWKIGNRRQVVYAKENLTIREQLAAVYDLIQNPRY
jgi:hypothetical protein